MTSLLKRYIYQRVNRQKGSILILTLWSLCLLSVYAVYLGHGVRQKLIMLQHFDERSRLRLIAEAGVEKAITQLGKDHTENYDALDDVWSKNPVAFRKINMGGGSFSVDYNYTDDRSGKPGLRYGMMDEERKVNINTADQKTLRRILIIIAGLDEIDAQELAASIVDWRDEDSQLSIPVGSAEDSYYRNFLHSYESKDAPFERLDELFLIRGMNRDIFAKLKDYITLYGSGKVNINTAPKKVLLVLGISPDVVEKIIIFRYGDDGELGTLDDNIFYSTSDIVPRLSQFCHMGISEIAELDIAADMYLVTSSDYFGIRSTARLKNRKRFLRVTCVVDRDGKILSWQEV